MTLYNIIMIRDHFYNILFLSVCLRSDLQVYYIVVD